MRIGFLSKLGAADDEAREQPPNLPKVGSSSQSLAQLLNEDEDKALLALNKPSGFLSTRSDDLDRATLLVLGKRQVCEQLSVQSFARSVNLTPAETRVLEQLCRGVRPTTIARQHGVAVSTVRTQIGSIRAKTGAASISELVRQVAVLPPMVNALRGAAAH